MKTPDDPVSAGELDDVELMRQAQHGIPEAFEQLVRRHQQPLLNFFRRMGVYTDAEDRVQETLLRVYKHRRRYRPTAKFTTFLYTVARHVWIDALRKTKRAEEFAVELEENAIHADDGGAARAQAKMDVEDALRKLPQKLRDVTVLAVYQGLRYDEIAQILNIPVGTVKSRMFMAVGRLREVFDDRTE